MHLAGLLISLTFLDGLLLGAVGIVGLSPDDLGVKAAEAD